MTRGRRKDMTIPPSRALLQQRDYRARKAAYLADLEVRVKKAEDENALLRQEVEALQAKLKAAPPPTQPLYGPEVTSCTTLRLHLHIARKASCTWVSFRRRPVRPLLRALPRRVCRQRWIVPVLRPPPLERHHPQGAQLALRVPPSPPHGAPDITQKYSEDWKQLEIIVHRVDRLCGVIGQFLGYVSHPANHRPDYIAQIRHYMRKLYKIQFNVGETLEVNLGLELASLHRVLAGQPVPVRMKKRRRPKFVFGQDIDKDWLDGTRCICRGRTSYLLNYPKVECQACQKFYHGGCVFYSEGVHSGPYICPLCCVKKGRVYPHSEVRVKHVAAETTEPDVYVDTKEMLDTFSKDIIYMRLPPPYTQTLFVDLIRFTPGQPENVAANGSAAASASRNGSASISGPPPMSLPNGSSAHSRAMHPQAHPHPHPHPHVHAHPHPHGPGPIPMAPGPFDMPHGPGPLGPGPSGHVPPPPPWASTSRWSSAAAAAAPPGARAMPPMPPSGEPLRSPIATPPHSGRKRKYPDDGPLPQPDDRLAPAPPIRSPKRHQSHQSTQSTPQPSGSRGNAGMSPSLAMMLAQAPPDPRSPTRQPSGPVPYPRGPPGMVPPSPVGVGRAPGPEDGMPSPSGSHHGVRKVKLTFPGNGAPNSRSEDERWGPPLPHDNRSPPGPPRH
ncbi:hypothetical protein NUW54_g2243 [Trametes sanguinea]|uniref:Uncharacterized protein n=1 Tax=Trametes sanguinea TaxID=158606 RepID=A0ACC1Q5G7_9APHY|nr:hypothetical protein NUW54_g2243 [Trametes sanguinea]